MGEVDYRNPAFVVSRSGRWIIVAEEFGWYLNLMPTTVVDIETGEAITFDRLLGITPSLEFSADERKVYFEAGDRKLKKIDLTDGTVTEIPLRFEAGRFAANADGTRLIITGPLGRDLYVMDTRTDRLTAQIQLPLP